MKREDLRLQKFIAQAGLASRRHAEDLIRAGKVRVNGKIVTELGVKIDPAADRVQVGKRSIQPPPRGVILFHKPRGVVCTLDDPEGRRCISDFLTTRYRSYFPVGRLDWNTTGLLILTNDGELADRLMHPKYAAERTYKVRVEGDVSENVFNKLESGIKLKEGPVSLQTKFLKREAGSTWLEITAREGRNRMVRRAMEKVGHPVIKLQRIKYGPFRLGNLKAGELRKLSGDEYTRFRRKILEPRPV